MEENSWKLSKEMVEHGFNHRYDKIMQDIKLACKNIGIEIDTNKLDELLKYLINEYDFDDISKTIILDNCIVTISLATLIWFERSRTELWMHVTIRRDSKVWESKYLIYIKGCADEEECKVFGGQLKPRFTRIGYYKTELDAICKSVCYMYSYESDQCKIAQDLFDQIYNCLINEELGFVNIENTDYDMEIMVNGLSYKNSKMVYDIMFKYGNDVTAFFEVPIGDVFKED